MADPAEIFNVLDSGSGVGTALDQAIDATTPAAALRGLVGFAFKSSTGDVILPQLGADGRILVDTQTVADTPLYANGKLDAGSATLVDVTGATITLGNSKVVSDISILVSCRQDTLFELQWIDGAATNVLGDFVVGAGQYSISANMGAMQFTTNATGTETLKVQAKNFSTLSAFRATISCITTP